ncbi:MAG: VIT1/CCC1 transporter family protein [Methanolobus sp.]|nr:VIT1/CCC1 transporter family protein [Methanolobus sp.]
MKLSAYIGKYWVGAEVIYAVIIAMTFTSILRTYIAVPGASYLPIVYSALFCCIAWGIADGSFYVWERKYNIRMENYIVDLSGSEQSRDDAILLIKEQLDDTILSNIPKEKKQELYRDLVISLAAAGRKETVSTRDAFTIILGILLISTTAGLMVVIPFFLTENLNLALNISNWLGIALLFVIGCYRAQETELHRMVKSGFSTAVIGILIASITVFLGG